MGIRLRYNSPGSQENMELEKTCKMLKQSLVFHKYSRTLFIKCGSICEIPKIVSIFYRSFPIPYFPMIQERYILTLFPLVLPVVLITIIFPVLTTIQSAYPLTWCSKSVPVVPITTHTLDFIHDLGQLILNLIHKGYSIIPVALTLDPFTLVSLKLHFTQ